MGTETGSSTRPQRAPSPASTSQRPSHPNATSQRNAPPNATRPLPAVNGAVNGAATKSGVVAAKSVKTASGVVGAGSGVVSAGSGVKTKIRMDGAAASGDAGPDADSAKPGKALPNQTGAPNRIKHDKSNSNFLVLSFVDAEMEFSTSYQSTRVVLCLFRHISHI